MWTYVWITSSNTHTICGPQLGWQFFTHTSHWNTYILFLPYSHNWLNKSMKHCSSWEANSHSASQEISWQNTVGHYHLCKSLSLVPILGQMNLFHTLPPMCLKFNPLLSFHLCLGLLTGLFPSGVSFDLQGLNQNFICISYLFHACYMPHPSHPPWFDHPNNIWWSVQVWNSSFCSLLQPPSTSSLLGPSIHLNTLAHTSTLTFSHSSKLMLLRAHEIERWGRLLYVAVSVFSSKNGEYINVQHNMQVPCLSGEVPEMLSVCYSFRVKWWELPKKIIFFY
jgi:hypothetical protein